MDTSTLKYRIREAYLLVGHELAVYLLPRQVDRHSSQLRILESLMQTRPQKAQSTPIEVWKKEYTAPSTARAHGAPVREP